MREQYFRDIVHQGVDVARQMFFTVEKEQDAVFSESYHAARETLAAKMEVEVAKRLEKIRIKRAGKKDRGSTGAAYEE